MRLLLATISFFLLTGVVRLTGWVSINFFLRAIFSCHTWRCFVQNNCVCLSVVLRALSKAIL